METLKTLSRTSLKKVFTLVKDNFLEKDSPQEEASAMSIDSTTLTTSNNTLAVNTVSLPIQDSAQPITSGGVYNAIQNFIMYEETN